MAMLPTAQTITVLSQKGGTGKTTTVRTLADAFRRVGLDVLVADLDPQGNLSDYYDVPSDASPTVAECSPGRPRPGMPSTTACSPGPRVDRRGAEHRRHEARAR